MPPENTIFYLDTYPHNVEYHLYVVGQEVGYTIYGVFWEEVHIYVDGRGDSVYEYVDWVDILVGCVEKSKNTYVYQRLSKREDVNGDCGVGINEKTPQRECELP